MPVKIEFETTNAAFEEPTGWTEIEIILRDIADSCGRECMPKGGTIRDSNGNRIGQWSATIDTEEQST